MWELEFWKLESSFWDKCYCIEIFEGETLGFFYFFWVKYFTKFTFFFKLTLLLDLEDFGENFF